MDTSDIPTDKESGADQRGFSSTDVFTVDHHSLRARKKTKPMRLCYFLGISLAGLVVLIVSGFFIYFTYLVVEHFRLDLIDPHRSATASADHIVVQSYYGKRVPKFDVVASVFVRLGGELSEAKTGEDGSRAPFLNETEQFGQWKSLYSQRVFSQIDLNSTEKIYHKKVDLPIPWDILSQFYKPHTYFPQIVNTFVIVPFSPDPIYNSSSLDNLTPFDLVSFAYSNLTDTPWTRSILQNLSRPLEPDHSVKYTSELDAFYDTSAVREFALRPVRDRWTSFDSKNSTSQGSNLTTELHQLEATTDDTEERQGLRVRRNATIKIKTRSHLSMAKANPDYDLFAYMSGRDTAAKSDPIFHIDPLNRGGPQIGRRIFKNLGHYQSHIMHSPEMVETGAHGSFFYGPYTILHSHAAGGQDWFTLPRINESSESQSADPVVIPWHITFDLLSNAKLAIIDIFDVFDGLVEGDPPVDDHHSTKAAFVEAEMLEYADFKNSLVGNNPTSSQRSILRRILFFTGGLISEPVAWILQLHYLYTRSTSTGIGLPSVILGSSAHLAFYMILIALPSPDVESGVIFVVKLFVIPALIPFILQVNLWLGLEFAWLSWNGIPVPVGFKRFKPNHAERMSRRIDQQFTWIQRGIIVVLMTVIYIYSPHVISSPLHSSSSSPRLSLSSLYSTGSSWSKLFGVVSHRYGWSLLASITLMSSLSQVLLNMRLGTFGGTYKVHVWTQIIGFILSWTPVVFKFIFGKFETTAPLDLSEFMAFAFNLVLFWQANTLPNVKQDEEPDE